MEEYVSLVVDATIKTGIMRQIEAFRTGFNQVIAFECLFFGVIFGFNSLIGLYLIKAVEQDKILPKISEGFNDRNI